MLLIDGVRYEEWTDLRETEDLEPMVVEHSKEIFGENTEYFDIKKRLESSFGRNRIPDGYVVEFNIPAKWHVVEIELSNHPIDTHIREQVNDFITATQKIISNNRHKIVDEIFAVINNNHHLRYKIENLIKSQEIHKFLTDLILYSAPCLTIIIEKKMEILEEELKASLRYSPMNVKEFRTFRRVGAEAVHAHLFEPLRKPPPNLPQIPTVKTVSSQFESIDISLPSSSLKSRYIHLPEKARRNNMFPLVKTNVQLITQEGDFETEHRISNPRGILKSSWLEGGGLDKWFDAHSELKTGDRLRITIIQPMKIYGLEIIK